MFENPDNKLVAPQTISSLAVRFRGVSFCDTVLSEGFVPVL